MRFPSKSPPKLFRGVSAHAHIFVGVPATELYLRMRQMLGQVESELLHFHSQWLEMGSGVSSFFSTNSKPSRVYKAHDGSINAICLLAKGKTRYLATASEDGTCAVWDTEKNELEAKMKGHSQYVTCIAMDESSVVTGSADKTLKRWDLHTGKHLTTFDGHSSIVSNIQLHKSLLFSTSYDRSARQWDLVSGECLQVYTGHKRGVGPLLVVNLDLPDRRTMRRKSRVGIHRRLSASWTGNVHTRGETFHRTLLITGSSDNTAKAWSILSPVSVVDYVGHGSGILCMAMKEEKRELFTGSSDGTVRSWDVETGQLLMVFDGHQAAVLCLRVSFPYTCVKWSIYSKFLYTSRCIEILLRTERAAGSI